MTPSIEKHHTQNKDSTIPSKLSILFSHHFYLALSVTHTFKRIAAGVMNHLVLLFNKDFSEVCFCKKKKKSPKEDTEKRGQ